MNPQQKLLIDRRGLCHRMPHQITRRCTFNKRSVGSIVVVDTNEYHLKSLLRSALTSRERVLAVGEKSGVMQGPSYFAIVYALES
jgi:hypothetical protein